MRPEPNRSSQIDAYDHRMVSVEFPACSYTDQTIPAITDTVRGPDVGNPLTTMQELITG